jgi:ApaG protein
LNHCNNSRQRARFRAPLDAGNRFLNDLPPLSEEKVEEMSSKSSSDACTRNVRVHVDAQFSKEHSDLQQGKWFFLYTIRVTNEGSETVQLINRHWVITDANGRVEEVRGPGVVGSQPVLREGESFEYTSGCPLNTAFGSMHGSYEMHTAAGDVFEAEVAGFALRQDAHSVN